MKKNNFDTMTKKKALAYCHTHANEFKSECYANGENGERHFSCLISILESGTISPKELPNYGMEY